MLLAKDTQKGRMYAPTRQRGPLPTYYEVPAISREAHLARLRRRAQRLTGREVYVLRALATSDAVLLARVMRFQPEGQRAYSELRSLVTVPADFRLREIQSKPTRTK